MRTCIDCNKTLTIEHFPLSHKNGQGRRKKCAECLKRYSREYNKIWYRRNAKSRCADVYRNTNKSRDNRRTKIWQYLLEHPCPCGESDPVVLEFDHIHPEDKEHDISNMIRHGLSWERILKEINKCQVLCANCHRRKTAKQLGWHAYLQPNITDA